MQNELRRRLWRPSTAIGLVKVFWHDGLGMSLYVKRLHRGQFIWPSTSCGAVSISAAQMAYMLEGIEIALAAIR